MQVIGATNGQPTGNWTVLMRGMNHWRGQVIPVNSETVANVGFVNQGKAGYNYAAGGVGMFAGAALFGPAGMLVGGLLPKGFKGTLVEFAIEMTDGTVLRAKGTPKEYESLVKWSMEAPGTGITGRLRAEAEASRVARSAPDADDEILTDEDHEWIQSQLEAGKPAATPAPPQSFEHLTDEDRERIRDEVVAAAAHRKARISEVRRSKLPRAEKANLIRQIKIEYYD